MIGLSQKETRFHPMTKDELKEYHWAFGRHSNLPNCCIDFFVEEWDMSECWQNEGNWYHQAIRAAKYGYVPCPRCLGTGNKVKIRWCLDECGKEHPDDFIPKRNTNVS